MKVLFYVFLFLWYNFNITEAILSTNNSYDQQAIYSIEQENNGLLYIYATVLTPNDIVKITTLNGRNIKEVYGYDFAQGFIEFEVEIKNNNNQVVYKENFEKPTVYNSVIGKYKIAEYNLSNNYTISMKNRFKLLTKIDGIENVQYFEWNDVYKKDDNDIEAGILYNDDIKIKNHWISYTESQYTDGTYPVFMLDIEYSKKMSLLLQRSMGSKYKNNIIAEYRINDSDNWKSTYVANSRNPYICNNRIIMIEPDYINTLEIMYIRIKIQSTDKDNNIIFESQWKYIEYDLKNI